MKHTGKVKEAQDRYNAWCARMGMTCIADLNKALEDGRATEFINLSEAYQERKYSEIANLLFSQSDTKKILMLAGPSSSGKTSSSLRIAQQCRVLGMTPKVIELDNYFVEREKTPRDGNGEYDFECLGAMDTDLFNSQINSLLSGEEVIIPRYDFKAGKKYFDPRNAMKLQDGDILMMEGIHALNPAFTKDIDQSKIFRVYVSAVTALFIDDETHNSTTDKRLLRRILRDNRTRGISPEENIMRWDSVKRGERRNIFPFQENADIVFNSSVIYDLPLLKFYAVPLLEKIRPESPAYSEARRLLKFLDVVRPLTEDEIQSVPPTSIMREFIGGQRLV